jgi:predicted methyltransferase
MALRGATRRSVTAGLLALAACGPKSEAAKAPPPAPGSLEWAAAGPWRFDVERDAFRHPVQTLSFLGVRPAMTVLEIYPGRGWYSAILAPYLKAGGGHLVAASFDPMGASDARLATLADFKQRFGDTKTFGYVEIVPLSSKTNQIAPPASVDMVLIMSSLNALMAEKIAQPALAQAFAALKPGGILGIEENRAKSTGLQDPQAGTGYVQEQFVKLLAEDAGFKFAGSSEINANPKDTKDHPFGVWTLPPMLATAPLGSPDNPSFDSAPYRAIGESDRMTLKFVKPDPSAPSAAPDGAQSGAPPR